MEGRERRGWHTHVPARHCHWPLPPCLRFVPLATAPKPSGRERGEENTGWVRERGGEEECAEREGARRRAGEGEKRR
jgi:hypothetical protein